METANTGTYSQDKGLLSVPQKHSSRRWLRLLPFLILQALVWVLVLVSSVKLNLHSGAFWRDELSSIILAQLPTISDMYANLDMDSAPLFFATLLKLLFAAGLGTSHAKLEVLGFVIFGGIGAALWWAARSLGSRVPIFGSIFLLLNGVVFFWGTTIRSYGLASLLAALLVGSVWRCIADGSWKWWGITTAISVACAQTNYQNTYVILSVCLSGAMVCSIRRQWRRSIAIVGIGVCAALSLLPYYHAIGGTATWKTLLTSGFDPLALLFDTFHNMGSGRMWLSALWMVFPVYLASSAFRQCWRACHKVIPGTWAGRVLFAGLTVLLLGVSVPIFVWVSGRDMEPWYFLPSFTVLACLMDVSWLRMRRRGRVIWGLSSVAALLLTLQALELFSFSTIRRTNLDLAVSQVSAKAAPADLIVVSPLWLGHAFKYYYHGSATWRLVPGLSPQDIDHMDGASILKLARNPKEAVSRLNDEIERTLRSGHRVWLIGAMQAPQEGELPEIPTNLKIVPCITYWEREVGLFLLKHATTQEELEIANPSSVISFEYISPMHIYSRFRN